MATGTTAPHHLHPHPHRASAASWLLSHVPSGSWPAPVPVSGSSFPRPLHQAQVPPTHKGPLTVPASTSFLLQRHWPSWEREQQTPHTKRLGSGSLGSCPMIRGEGMASGLRLPRKVKVVPWLGLDWRFGGGGVGGMGKPGVFVFSQHQRDSDRAAPTDQGMLPGPGTLKKAFEIQLRDAGST